MSKYIFSKKFIFLFFLSILSGMGKETRIEIKNQYQLYTTLLKERKILHEEVIHVCLKKLNNVHYLETIHQVNHETLTNKISFIVTVKVINHKYFSFKLRCQDLSEKPFFGYDSDGASHRNYDDNIPLAQQQIETPHFNYYDEQGIRKAYKTDKLNNPSECAALEDINLCVVHYCYEANIRLKEKDFPSIDFPATSLFEENENGIDPNLNIQFV